MAILDKCTNASGIRLGSSQPDLRLLDRKGLLWMLDEIVSNPSATDSMLLDRVFNTFSDRGKLHLTLFNFKIHLVV